MHIRSARTPTLVLLLHQTIVVEWINTPTQGYLYYLSMNDGKGFGAHQKSSEVRTESFRFGVNQRR